MFEGFSPAFEQRVPGRAAAAGTSRGIRLATFQTAQCVCPRASPESHSSSRGAGSQAVLSCICAGMWEAQASPRRDINDRPCGWWKSTGFGGERPGLTRAPRPAPLHSFPGSFPRRQAAPLWLGDQQLARPCSLGGPRLLLLSQRRSCHCPFCGESA